MLGAVPSLGTMAARSGPAAAQAAVTSSRQSVAGSVTGVVVALVVDGCSSTGTVAGGFAVVAGGCVVVSAGAVVPGGTSSGTAASSDPPHAISVIAIAAITASVVRVVFTGDSSVVPQRHELAGRADEDHLLVAAAQRARRCCRSATRVNA
jgi:hypothetical protein